QARTLPWRQHRLSDRRPDGAGSLLGASADGRAGDGGAQAAGVAPALTRVGRVSAEAWAVGGAAPGGREPRVAGGGPWGSARRRAGCGSWSARRSGRGAVRVDGSRRPASTR